MKKLILSSLAIFFFFSSISESKDYSKWIAETESGGIVVLGYDDIKELTKSDILRQQQIKSFCKKYFGKDVVQYSPIKVLIPQKLYGLNVEVNGNIIGKEKYQLIFLTYPDNKNNIFAKIRIRASNKNNPEIDHNNYLGYFHIATQYPYKSEKFNLRMGEYYYDVKDYERALSYFNFIINSGPKDSSAYIFRAGVFKAQKQYDKAISDYNKILTNSPKFYEIHGLLADAYFLSGEYDKAIVECDEALKGEKQYFSVYLIRGGAYSKKNQPDKAIADFSKAIEIKKDGGAFYWRSVEYFKKGQYKDAWSDIQEAQKLGCKDIDSKYLDKLKKLAMN